MDFTPRRTAWMSCFVNSDKFKNAIGAIERRKLPIWPAVAGDLRADITQLEHLLFVVKRGRSSKQSVMRFR